VHQFEIRRGTALQICFSTGPMPLNSGCSRSHCIEMFRQRTDECCCCCECCCFNHHLCDDGYHNIRINLPLSIAIAQCFPESSTVNVSVVDDDENSWLTEPILPANAKVLLSVEASSPHFPFCFLNRVDPVNLSSHVRSSKCWR
jgi:hypothetical protein